MMTRAVRLTAMGLFLVVLLVQASGLVALAEGDQTIALTNDTPVAGTLAGSAAGSFAYYQVEYPGNAADVRIQVTFGPHDPTISPQIGLNVYGPNGYQGKGDMQEGGYLEVSYASDEAASLLVQVYNYSDQAMPYSVTVTGLPATRAAAAPETTVTTTTTETTPAAEQKTTSAVNVSNMIVGSLAGAFGNHPFQYAGDGSSVTVTMNFSPADPSFRGAFGFTVYGPNGNVIANGAENSTLGQLTATFSSDVAGQYLILVYNYTDGVPLTYTLTTAM